jgi:hypothetical protein
MINIIAIDPGANGGIAWVEDFTIHAAPMPDGMTEQADTIREIWVNGKIKKAVIEKTGSYVPGNSGPAAATFARHCGHIEAILYMLSLPTIQVAPQIWQKSLGSLPKDKKERKNAIKEQMARRYPYLKVTLKTADALGILTYALAYSKGTT